MNCVAVRCLLEWIKRTSRNVTMRCRIEVQIYIKDIYVYVDRFLLYINAWMDGWMDGGSVRMRISEILGGV